MKFLMRLNTPLMDLTATRKLFWKKFLFRFLFLLLPVVGLSQDDTWNWWNDIHHWKPGMPGWRNMMLLSPGYLGPNALPVPEMKQGLISGKPELETTLSAHFRSGDPTQDFSARIYYPVAGGKMAFEAYGVLLEKYGYSEAIRNERISRDKDGKGVVPGDFWFATLIQLVRNRKFPDTILRLACKTASGDAFAARYTDTPGYFFDFTSSESFEWAGGTLRPIASFGFYSWQTYNEATPQNDAWLYGAGISFLRKTWRCSGYFSGYSGYLKLKDKPQLLTLETIRELGDHALKVQLLHGIRDWKYTTLRFSFIWRIGD